MDKKQALKRLKDVMGSQSKTEFARQIGVTPQYICDILAGRKEIGPTVLKAIGLKRKKVVTVTYEERKQ